MKLEMLALKWAVTDNFREYLLGSKFVVYTDNNPWFISILQSWEQLKCAGLLNLFNLTFQ